MGNPEQNEDFYWDLGFKTIKNLETDRGILASSRNELYGCIFGRDSLITNLKLLRVYKKTGVDELLPLVKKSLLSLFELQGKEVNVESGEEPGKCIHEYRPDNHDHLTKNGNPPWYVYPDGEMRNYDTVDATPLLLIAAYRYWQLSEDKAFLKKVLPKVELSLQWIAVYGDSNGDGFIDYEFHPERKYGGLLSQNWMDSSSSVFHEDGGKVVFPLAPVETQGYTFLALRLWSNYFLNSNDKEKAKALKRRSLEIKRKFNKEFIIFDDEGPYLAAGIDGRGQPLRSIRSSMGHVFWSSLSKAYGDKKVDGILYKKHASSIVKRLLSPGLFEKTAGIRTLSSRSHIFNPSSYHNGSIWPHDNGIIVEGLENYGFIKEAHKVREAILGAVSHFETSIELFVFKDGKYLDYRSKHGQVACKQQAWSAAAILDMAISELQ